MGALVALMGALASLCGGVGGLLGWFFSKRKRGIETSQMEQSLREAMTKELAGVHAALRRCEERDRNREIRFQRYQDQQREAMGLLEQEVERCREHRQRQQEEG